MAWSTCYKFRVSWSSAAHYLALICFSKNISRKILSMMFAYPTRAKVNFWHVPIHYSPYRTKFTMKNKFMVHFSDFLWLLWNLCWSHQKFIALQKGYSSTSLQSCKPNQPSQTDLYLKTNFIKVFWKICSDIRRNWQKKIKFISRFRKSSLPPLTTLNSPENFTAFRKCLSSPFLLTTFLSLLHYFCLYHQKKVREIMKL